MNDALFPVAVFVGFPLVGATFIGVIVGVVKALMWVAPRFHDIVGVGLGTAFVLYCVCFILGVCLTLGPVKE